MPQAQLRPKYVPSGCTAFISSACSASCALGNLGEPPICRLLRRGKPVSLSGSFDILCALPAMNDMLRLPKTLATRLRKMSHKQGDSPATIAEVAIDEHLRYLEWKEKAIAAGDADIAAGRTLTTGQMLAAISRQRAARGRKSKKTRS